MAVPRNIYQHFEIVFRGEIEKPLGRRMINANEVGLKFPDLRKIAGRLFGRRERLAGGVRRERPIRHAFDVELFLAYSEKFTVYDCAWTDRSRYCHEL